MSSNFRFAVAASLLLSADPAATESLPATDDEIRIGEAFSVETFRDTCHEIIGPVTPAMKRIARAAEREFVAGNGQAAWDAAMAEARELAAPFREADSPHYFCADVNAVFVELKIDTGLKGPSFRCNGNLLPSQRAICDGGPIAWGYERALTSIVADLQGNLNDKGKAEVAKFLAEAEPDLAACGTRSGCAADAIEWRARELSVFYVKVVERRRSQ